MTARAQSSPPVSGAALRPVPRRGLRLPEAATYVGISPSKFLDLVRTKRMPEPLKLDGCVLWDVRQIDTAFDVLIDGEQAGGDDGIDWDDVAR